MILYIFVKITTHQRFITELYNIKQGQDVKSTKPNQKRKKHKDKEAMETLSYQKAKDKMAIRRPYITIITLNVNGLNSPINGTEF